MTQDNLLLSISENFYIVLLLCDFLDFEKAGVKQDIVDRGGGK